MAFDTCQTPWPLISHRCARHGNASHRIASHRTQHRTARGIAPHVASHRTAAHRFERAASHTQHTPHRSSRPRRPRGADDVCRACRAAPPPPQSFNFRVDCFAFDPELQAAQRAASFAPALHQLARRAQHALFGRGRFLAAHLRRDGYESYCAGSGLRYYGEKRYGVQVDPEMCFPSIAQVAAALRLLLDRHSLASVRTAPSCSVR